MKANHPIKICGLTRESDVLSCVEHGVNALGFVLYEPSPRYVSPSRAAQLAKLLPAFVSPVLLFVNASSQTVTEAAKLVPGAWLQFHGDESPEFCEDLASQLGRRWIKAIRIPTNLQESEQVRDKLKDEIVKYAERYQNANALLLDTWVAEYGGSGKSFDWSVVPDALDVHLIVSGGLTSHNVHHAIETLSPRVKTLSVDVSSGVEVSKGIKEASLIKAFAAAVRS
jgi:phosphoribosylanthranilate isomerase